MRAVGTIATQPRARRYAAEYPRDVRSGLLVDRAGRPVLRELGLSPLEPLIVVVKVDRASESRIPWGAQSLTLTPVRFGRRSVNLSLAGHASRASPRSAQPIQTQAYNTNIFQFIIDNYESYSLELAGAIEWLRKC